MEDGAAAEEVPLRVGFAQAQQKLRALGASTLASRSDEYQELVRALVQQLRACLDQIRRLSLFSANESADDYTTSELRLVLTDAYLGEVLQKVNDGQRSRTEILEQALAHYRKFLSTCRDLGVGKQQQQKQREKEGEGEDEEGARRGAADAGQARMQKIERLRRQRAMEKEVAELEARLAAGDGAGRKGREDDDEDLDDVEREHAVKLIELKIHQVTDDIGLVQSELEMARQMDAMRSARPSAAASDPRRPGAAAGSAAAAAAAGGAPDEWRLDAPARGQIDPRTGKLRPTFNARGQPMQPFVLTNDRQRIKDGVFRPDWALPTMTVDEYLEQERQRGNIISGGGKEPDPRPEISDNDHDALDAEVDKQREWDDFKDDNPRGWGNRGGNRG
ncbi:Type 2A phosphatase-associated protein 42 [Coemansia javaensis]|uniref:Type 2A phosphatase-associated protein 42 n=1 Tax=Coemansia javaensis TaxID=2761396 RepID=A0A9W8HJC2_9FUNG|nr:Type 2A phosphatase-associated protein 42 [Coemansia javaensis]